VPTDHTLAVFGAIGGIGGVLGVIVGAASLIWARKSANASERSADASERSAKASEDSATTSREALAHEQRAFEASHLAEVVPLDCEFEQDAEKRVTFTLKVHNYGPATGKDLRLWAYWPTENWANTWKPEQKYWNEDYRGTKTILELPPRSRRNSCREIHKKF
jgi:hypothetical protein